MAGSLVAKVKYKYKEKKRRKTHPQVRVSTGATGAGEGGQEQAKAYRRVCEQVQKWLGGCGEYVRAGCRCE